MKDFFFKKKLFDKVDENKIKKNIKP